MEVGLGVMNIFTQVGRHQDVLILVLMEVGLGDINSNELIKNHTCFTCDFWLEHLEADEQLAKEHKAFVS